MADNALMPWAEVKQMAEVAVRSQLFPSVRTPEAALVLMLLCQAEGLHPIQALRRYDIIQGKMGGPPRPALKSDAMLADFQKYGGKVKWLRLDNEAAEAEFHAPGLVEPVKIKFDTEDARRAGLLTKDNWLKYPRAMRRARVISEGVRTAMPAVNTGIYSPEEVRDFEEVAVPTEAEVVSSAPAPVPDEAEHEAEQDYKGRPIPGHCTFKGCQGEVLIYQSTSKQFYGRDYAMCEAAYRTKQDMLDAGSTNREANAAVSKHYREWAEPWPRKDALPATEGGAGAELE